MDRTTLAGTVAIGGCALCVVGVLVGPLVFTFVGVALSITAVMLAATGRRR